MPPSTVRILLRFLGSMNLAITLLVAIAIAAVIGTVVQQNQPYPDYVFKFGPFWFEVFKQLDLFNVYSSAWFLTILGFLVLSTSVCVYRNLPAIVKDINDYRENSQRSALLKQPYQQTFDQSATLADSLAAISALLKQHHYRFRLKQEGNSYLVAAKKGTASRLGYIFSHLAIIVICVGGLLDGNLSLKIAEWRGKIAVETRRIPASEIPAISTLGDDNLSFRANVDIAERGQADLAFIDYKDGYLLQKLPFTIQVDDFRIEHYPSGQPKSFESDLTILDPATTQAFKQTISVNHPLNYQGYTIYQNSFGDGGSKLSLKAWPLTTAQVAKSLQASVKAHTPIDTQTLEISDFRPFNVNPDPSGAKKFINLGPTFQYKLRDATGIANEYITYMQPTQQDGRWFYSSGMRSKVSESFKYWMMPADANQRLDRFMAFYQGLHNPQKLQKLATQAANASKAAQQSDLKQRQAVAAFMVQLGQQFASGGYEQIASTIEKTVEEPRRQQVSEIYAAALQQLLKNLYLDVLQQEGVKTEAGLSDFDSQFYTDAVDAANLGYLYASPWFFELERFQHIEATGLQITRSPGQWLVFPGCLLLVLGVFCMFYLPQRRLWLLVDTKDQGVSILLAGNAVRNRYDFDREFAGIAQQLNPTV